MTIRADMAAACAAWTANFETRCGGRVRLTQAHIDAAAGEDMDEHTADILAEARLGCAQACGCQHATAWLTGALDGVYVVARCALAPGELELGHRDAPEPDGAR